ncbi:siderophore-iron transporter Str1 [Kwoniella heveanensis BCC8398]|uniref:Siderophore-iron transporter Str1 n=1 Tax=Kwoniella heveanensis BCC8398 TaxID=1296120 RepID=A0A1B9H2I3_9TREE|nr:siderophore-iron transporter Str1 [Kwoniella heveanensis BCC8398]
MSRVLDRMPNAFSARPTFLRSHTDAGVDAKDANATSEEDGHQPGATVPHLDHDEASRDDASSLDIEQSDGVTKIEALYLVFGKGWKLYTLWLSIALICIAYSLSQMTTYAYAPFATSSFGEHTILGTISVITSIMSGVTKPFIAKCADLFSRPWALTFSVVFYTLGYIIVASSQTVGAVAGGEVLQTLGNTGINFVSSILIADITSLQWRGFVSGLYSLPFIPFAFVAGDIAAGINAYSENGWRWGFGMFCIIVPVTIAPSIIILFWGDYKAKKVGALSLASSSYARQRALGKADQPARSLPSLLLYYARQIDAFGLLLLTFSFGCILSPFTLNTTAKGGYTNPSLIALFVVGGVLLIAFCAWEWRFASHPIMPRRVLNRTLICCTFIDFMYFFSGSLGGTYWSSWLYVTKDYSAQHYTYLTNTLTVGLCFFGACAGLIQRYTHRYKYLQLIGLSIRIIAQGLVYHSASKATAGNTATIVMGQILISIGGGISVISSSVAVQASVPHQDMALAMALLSLWTSIGGSIASAIAAAVWNKQVPLKLAQHLGDSFNSTEIAQIFGSIVVARTTEPRELVIQSYNEAIRPLYLAGLVSSTLSLVAGAYTTNFYLGKTHNAIEKKVVVFRSAEETAPEVLAAKAKEVEEKVAAKVGLTAN